MGVTIVSPSHFGRTTEDFVWKTLESITWPLCFSRNIVKPDGAFYIDAYQPQPEGRMAKGCYLLFCQWRVVIVTHSHSKREVGKVWPWHHACPPWGVEECDHAHPLLLP